METRVKNPKDQFGEGRVVAQHNRWHLKRHLLKPGCKYCYTEPPHTPTPDPVITPDSQVQTDPYELQLWISRVEKLAGTGCPTEVAAKIMKLQLPMFIGQVKVAFNESWPELQERMRLTSLANVQIAALELAEKGRPRLFESLDRNGLLPTLVLARKDLDEGQKHPVSRMSDKELTERLQAVLDTRPWVEKQVLKATLSIEEPKVGEGLVVGARKSNQESEWDAPRHEPAKADLPVPEPVKSDIPIVVAPDEPQGPITARPRSGVLVMEDHVRNTEMIGAVKKHILEELR